MRIVHYLSVIHLEHGGVVRAVLDLCRIMAGRGDSIVLASWDARDVPAEWRDGGEGVPKVIQIMPPNLPGGFRSGRAMAELKAIAAGADVIHLHTVWDFGNLAWARMARQLGIPYVVTLHGMLDDWSMSQRAVKKRIAYRLLIQRFLQRASLVHATARGELRQAEKWIAPGQGDVLPCLVDLAPYLELPSPEAARAQFPVLASGCPVVLLLSRLHPKKGIEVLLETADKLRPADGKPPVCQFIIAGSGEPAYENELRELARSLKVDDIVHFVGPVYGEMKFSLYRACDLFALPTSQENFGLVLLEAMACATPVVTTEGVDIHDELQEGGAIITRNDAEAIAHAIREQLADRDALRRRGVQGREWVLRSMSVERVARQYDQFYQRAAGAVRKGEFPTEHAKPAVAIIANSTTPYREHLHLRIARELPQIRLWSVFTHEESNSNWRFAPPQEIGPVRFGAGQASRDQSRPLYAIREWRKGRAIAQWLHQHHVRAVVMMGYNDAGRMHLIRFCRDQGIRCFLFGDSNIHGDATPGFKGLAKRRIVGGVVRNVSGVFPCGSLGRSYFLKYGADPSRIYYFPYEPDYSLAGASAEAVAAALGRFGLSPARRRMVFSGRLMPVKRPDLLLQAFFLICNARPEWDLLIIGGGELMGDLKAQIPGQLAHRVTFTGFLDDQPTIAALYRGCDVLVLPSDFEPWALVINEAAAAGLAIVASNVVGAAAELVRDGVNGRIFPRGELAALQEALWDVTSPQKIEAMKAASAGVLAEWRSRADPVQGLRAALADAEIINNASLPR